jgi:peptidoglycan-associated lipoprotein
MRNKILSIAILAFFVSGCSHFGGKSSEGAPIVDGTAQSSGLGNQDGINGADASNKLKPAYNQVYYFDFNKYDVHQDDVASVHVQGDYLTAHSNAKIRIEGNADERGSREYNIALGWKRAKAVAAILKQQGVGDSQIAMVSFGKEKPVAFGHDEASYSLNRRVNLIYEAK